jgi:hypothetical protein
MPPTRRRDVLAALGTAAVGGLAGCADLLSDRPPAGSLRFENDHDLPHVVSVRVTDVGAEVGDGPGAVTGDVVVPPAQRRLSAAASVEPGARRTYEATFTDPVWYAVEFEVDGREPPNDTGRVAFNPAPDGEDTYRFLAGRVFESGEFGWVVSSTDDAGSLRT